MLESIISWWLANRYALGYNFACILTLIITPITVGVLSVKFFRKFYVCNQIRDEFEEHSLKAHDIFLNRICLPIKVKLREFNAYVAAHW